MENHKSGYNALNRGGAMNVFIGYDSREQAAYEVAKASLLRSASAPVDVYPLEAGDLYRRHLLWRPVEKVTGVMWDHLSDAAQSTEFATSRFLVPFIQRTGWALFVDSDVVFLADVAELFALADPKYAVMCVKHLPLACEPTKMDAQPQQPYYRKNWSSVMLVNCDHPAHLRLSLPMVNYWPGALLHRFAWLRDEEIGALPPEWNWLVSVQPKPETPKLAHFTLGTPDMVGDCEHAEIWRNYAL